MRGKNKKKIFLNPTAIFCNAFCFFCTISRTQSLVPFLQMSGDPGLIQQPTTQQSDPNFVTNQQPDPVQNQMNGSAMGPSTINQMVSSSSISPIEGGFPKSWSTGISDHIVKRQTVIR